MMKANLLQLLDRFAQLKVLILGDAIVDRYVEMRAQRLCREAPAPIADFQMSEDVPGGAAHTAVNIATLGAKALFLTVIGSDEAGQALVKKMAELGVET